MRAFFLASTLPLAVAAQESAAFLKIATSARAVGMGGANTAAPNEAASMTGNPASLAGLTAQAVGMTHAELFANTSYDFLGYALPARRGTFAAMTSFLSQASLDGRDESGNPTGGFSASDTAVGLSYSAQVLKRLGVGAGVKYVQSAIADASARTFAVDLGGLYEFARLGPGTPRFGVSIQNMGPGLRFMAERMPLPLTLATGFSYSSPAGVTWSIDYRQYPRHRRAELGCGAEYALAQGFALRAGYSRAMAQVSGGASLLAGVAGGVGFTRRGYSIDYAITPFAELGNAQRLSLGARF